MKNEALKLKLEKAHRILHMEGLAEDTSRGHITLRDEKIECNGRIIPLHTADWHEYRLESDNGQFCRLVIDGEVISGRIEPVASKEFQLRGIYALCSLPNEESKGEMEFIRIR